MHLLIIFIIIYEEYTLFEKKYKRNKVCFVIY